MMWQHAVYPVALLTSFAGMAWIDRTHKLAFWHNWRRATLTIVTSVMYFTIWDIAGISADIFYPADATYRSGLLLGPSFPIEEILFLTLLSYTILVTWTYRKQQS